MPISHANPWGSVVDAIAANKPADSALPAPSRRMGRPPGPLRNALLTAAAELAAERQLSPLQGVDGRPLVGATWPELRQRAQLAKVSGRRTLTDACRAGHLASVGKVRVQGERRPLCVFAPQEPAPNDGASQTLQNTLAMWARP